jgi:hypothetical protein
MERKERFAENKIASTAYRRHLHRTSTPNNGVLKIRFNPSKLTDVPVENSGSIVRNADMIMNHGWIIL